MTDVEQNALDAVAEAVRAAHEASGQAVTLDPKDEAIVDFGNLSAEPLVKFAEAAAVHIEQVGEEILNEGAKLNQDCIRLASDIRNVAKAQAEAIRANCARTRAAAKGLMAIRDEFRADIARELEAVRAREEKEKTVAAA